MCGVALYRKWTQTFMSPPSRVLGLYPANLHSGCTEKPDVRSCEWDVWPVWEGDRVRGRTESCSCALSRYGVKGPVYLKNREGLVVAVGQDGSCEWQSGSIRRHSDHIATSCGCGTSTFRLFNHVTVSGWELNNPYLERVSFYLWHLSTAVGGKTADKGGGGLIIKEALNYSSWNH